MKDKMDNITKSAIISQCGNYRFSLYRQWNFGEDIKKCLFVMLNPSTADMNMDDPTVKKCIKIANHNGCGRMEIVNLFPFRSPHPSKVKAEPQNVRDENLNHIMMAAHQSDLIIFAWGNGLPNLCMKSSIFLVTETLKRAGKTEYFCLGKTKDGNPKHPLARGKSFVKHDMELVPYN